MLQFWLQYVFCILMWKRWCSYMHGFKIYAFITNSSVKNNAIIFKKNNSVYEKTTKLLNIFYLLSSHEANNPLVSRVENFQNFLWFYIAFPRASLLLHITFPRAWVMLEWYMAEWYMTEWYMRTAVLIYHSTAWYMRSAVLIWHSHTWDTVG